MIWGKTYPELSKNYVETVCTGAVELETGRPLRLFPVPLRYLASGKPYALYDIIEVDVARSPRDPRPESHRIVPDSLRVIDQIGPDRFEWAERRKLIFRDPTWHFPSVAALKVAQAANTSSMGLVTPGEIVGVSVEERPESDRREYEQKWDLITSQQDMFRPEYRELEYLPVKIRLQWRCHLVAGCTCERNPHNMSVIDWGLLELGRREGNWDLCRQKLESIANLESHDFRVYLGNMFLHPTTFVIIGLWYPQRQLQQPLL